MNYACLNQEKNKIHFATKEYPTFLPIEEVEIDEPNKEKSRKLKKYYDGFKYAFINPENNKVYFKTREEPIILPVEYSKPELDDKLFIINENSMSEWEILEDKVVATYDITEKKLEDEKEQNINLFKRIHKIVKNAGLAFDYNNEKLYLSTKEFILDEINEKLESGDTEWIEDPIQWDSVDEKKLKMMKRLIESHYTMCDQRLNELLELVDACQTIYGLYEIEYLTEWPNTLVSTYEDGTVRMFMMDELLDDEGYLNYEKAGKVEEVE